MTVSILVILAAIEAAVFCGVLAIRKRSGPLALAMPAAVLLSALLLVFDLVSSLRPGELPFWRKLSLVTESFLPAGWLLASLIHSREPSLKSVSWLQKALLAVSVSFPVAALLLPAGSFFYSPDFEFEKVLFLGGDGFTFYTGVLVYMIVAAVNMEATLRGAQKVERWKIKFETLGAGAILAIFIFYYSQALLYRSLDMDLLGPRSIVLILAIGLMAYSKLMRGNGVKVQISKEMAYRSTVILVVGVYLLGLGIIGEGMRHFGEKMSRNLLTMLFFLGGAGIVIVLLSENIQRKIKVFLSKNFFSDKYDYRAQWLSFTDRVSSAKTSEGVLKAILSGFSETFGTKGAAFFLKNENDGNYESVSVYELDISARELRDGSGLIGFIEPKGWVLNASDGGHGLQETDKRFLEENGISFLVPLFTGGSMNGFIALGSPINGKEVYTFEDYDLMKTLSRQASSIIHNLKLSDELSRARQMEAIGRVSAFVVHDLKNHVSSLSMMVDNADEHIDDPEFQKDMVDSLKSTVKKMNVLISRLRNIKEKTALNLQSADLRAIAEDALRGVSGDVRLEGPSVLAEADPDEIQKVVLNIVLNAIEASPVRAPVYVEVGSSDSAYISVRDGGCGMSAEFIEPRLFKLFSTTKKKGLGIGLYQCKQVVEAHGGAIEVASQPGQGTVFTIKLPLAKLHDNMLNFQAG